jgi:hypothetical protein
MVQTLEELSLLAIAGIVAAIVLAAVALYVLVQRLPRRRNSERGLAVERTQVAPTGHSAAVGTDTLPDPRTLARIRAGREGDRPSEDDIARARMGARGTPGEPAPAPDLDESITQTPKGLDPGHTA